MKFLAGFVAISAAISQALAVALTNSAYDITEGQAFTLTWSDADGDVTLLLKDGPSNNLGTVATIASGVSGSSFTWTPSGIASGTYAIEIEDESGTPNYSPQFSYAGTGSATTTTTGSSSSSATGTTTVSSTGTVTTTTTSSSGTTTSSSSTTSSSGTTSASSSSVTGSANSTSTLSSSTRSSTSTRTSTSSSSSSTSSIVNTNDSQKLGSPLALILLTAAALFICN